MQNEYFIYLRKSRVDIEAESSGSGDTLERHRRHLLELARSNGYNITQIFEEVVSGESIAARPEMQKLLRAVETGVAAGVLCMEVERLARGDTSDQGIVAKTFKYSNTKIITPSKIYDPSDEFDETFFEFGLFMSRQEYKTINRRLQRGRQASLQEGKYISSTAPYGYERVKLKGQKGYSLAIVPEQAEIVKAIFNWFANDGLGGSLIARRLNEQNVPSPTGSSWAPYSVRDMIKNPTYAGYVRWSARPVKKQVRDGVVIETRASNQDAQIYKGLHEPIVSQDLYDRANAALSSRSHPPLKPAYEIQSPFVGLMYCSKCGRAMLRRPVKRGRTMLICPNAACETKMAVLEEVEDAVLDALRIWLADYKVKVKAELEIVNNTAPSAIPRLEQTLTTLHRQSDNLYDLLEQEVYTIEVFTQRSKYIADRISKVQTELEKAVQEEQRSAVLNTSKLLIIPRIENVLSAYRTAETPKEQNDLLKSVLTRILYSKSTGGRWAKDSDMNVLVFPKTEF